MNETKRKHAELIFLILARLFIAARFTGNLIFQKFFHWKPLGLYEFRLSVAIIQYPLTFLVTDIISELYGRKMANRAVISGLFASIFTLLLIALAGEAPATTWSPVDDDEFKKVFGCTFIAAGSSLAAYLPAQFIDVQVFNYSERLTKGRHLWQRNNTSAFSSPLLNTFTVLFLLYRFGVIEWKLFKGLLINEFVFKIFFAALGTPSAYLTICGQGLISISKKPKKN